MADEPISQLTQIAAPPFATAFTNPSSGAMLEILDTTNTSMASSGTNSKIAPGDLLKGYLAAGSNVTLTETAGIVTIAASGGSGSANVVYASSISGIHLDGSTDDTSAIQTVLNSHGTAGTPLRLVMDGISAINTLYVYTGQHIDGIAGLGGFTKLPYPSSNGQVAITNKHWFTGNNTLYGTDKYITLTNLYIDGNRRNGACGAAYPNSGYPEVSPSFYEVPTIGFYGLQYLRVDNVHVFDAPAYGLHLANVQHAVVTNYSMFANTGDTHDGSNPIQLEGYCDDCQFYGVTGSCNDDPWAFNADDGQEIAGAGSSLSQPTFYPGTVAPAGGPITNCMIDGGTFYPVPSGSLMTGGRFLSSYTTSFIKNVTVKNITVTGVGVGIQIDNFGLANGSGFYDNIILENYRLEMAASFAPIWINRATVGNLIIKDLTVLTTTAIGSAASAIYVTSNGSVGSLRVSGLDLENSAGVANTSSPVVLAGTVTQASFRDTRINQGTTQFAGPAISCTGTIGSLQVDGGVFDHINNVVGVSGGTTSIVSAVNLVHTNTSGGTSFSQTGGTFSGLALGPGAYASTVASGTIGTFVPISVDYPSPAIMSNATSLQVGQSGDTYGATYLTFENRGGLNGAAFHNAGLQLVDFAFIDSASYQNNIRFGSGSFSHGYGNTAGEMNVLIDTNALAINAFYAGIGSCQFYPAGAGLISLNLAAGTQPAGAMHIVSAGTSTPGLVVDGLSSQTADLQEWRNSTPTVLTRIRADGSIALPTLADSSAVNSSLYFSSTTSKLCYKDSSGTLHAV